MFAVPEAIVFPQTRNCENPPTLVEYPPLAVMVDCGMVDVEGTTCTLKAGWPAIEALGCKVPVQVPVTCKNTVAFVLGAMLAH